MNIELAISIALQAHKGQIDKGGHPYILHPLAVMNRVETMEEKIVAVLHDVIEDTDVTIEALREYGFSEEILTAIRLLTRSKEDTYEQFIEKTLMNPIARNVKIADIKENMNISRIKNPTEHDYNRLEKYKKAVERLEEHTTEPVQFFHVNDPYRGLVI
ncbi:GTP pyrophosphokinase [Paenibacillus amylolyticus]|uniref:GTP pyrophosphokinase n=1 Tax=Paenibacillus amylolyticus TaxID=1451 RepID=UPI003EB97457